MRRPVHGLLRGRLLNVHELTTDVSHAVNMDDVIRFAESLGPGVDRAFRANAWSETYSEPNHVRGSIGSCRGHSPAIAGRAPSSEPRDSVQTDMKTFLL